MFRQGAQICLTLKLNINPLEGGPHAIHLCSLRCTNWAMTISNLSIMKQYVRQIHKSVKRVTEGRVWHQDLVGEAMCYLILWLLVRGLQKGKRKGRQFTHSFFFFRHMPSFWHPQRKINPYFLQISARSKRLFKKLLQVIWNRALETQYFSKVTVNKIFTMIFFIMHVELVFYTINTLQNIFILYREHYRNFWGCIISLKRQIS